MSWIFFAIAAPALYAASNFVDKFLIEKRVRDPMILAVLGGFSTCLTGLGILVFRGFPGVPSNQLFYLLLAGVLFEVAIVPWYKAISVEDVSRVAPLGQAIPVIVLILSYLFLGERLAEKQLLGFLFILAGGFLLSVKTFGKGIFKARKALWYMLAASSLFAIPLVLFKFVSLEQGFWGSLAYEFIGGGIGALVLFLYVVFSRRPNFREEIVQTRFGTWAIIGSNEALYIFSRVLNFYAIALASVSLVTVFGGFQPFFMLGFGLILSRWFPNVVKEDVEKKTLALKLAAIVLIFAGVWFINK
ncbi:MAG: EamA family transporter [Candidatus Liptonbacteria bacterium]|nr:EamA family transporter [Candidatus Liptonbacteria bacterium]